MLRVATIITVAALSLFKIYSSRRIGLETKYKILLGWERCRGKLCGIMSKVITNLNDKPRKLIAI
jgi:hypothetical protein